MRAPLAIAAAALMAAACSEPPRLTIDAPAGWRSAIVGLQTPRDLTVIAHAGPAPIELARDDVREVEVVVVFYDTPLPSLLVVPGVIDPMLAVRPLPPTALGGRVRVMADGELGAEESISVQDPRAQRLRLPPIDGASCASAGQCLQIRLDERSCIDECTLPRLPDLALPAAPATPAPPEPPAALRIAPCPAGWTVDDDGCAPPLLPARVACPPHQAQHYGQAACTTVGAPCPAGPWATTLPGGRPRVFVDPRGRAGPGGEPSTTSLEAALRTAPADAVLVLSRETHAGGVVLGAGQALLGACAEGTVIESAPGRTTVAGGGALQDLTVRGPVHDAHAIQVPAARTMALRGVIVERQGIVAEGALDGEDLLIRGGAGGPEPWGPPRAIWTLGEGSADVRRAVIEHGGSEAVIAGGAGTRATLEDLVVVATATATLLASQGGALTAARAQLVGAAVRADRGGRVELAEVALTADRASALARSGIVALEGGQVSGREVVVDRPSTQAIEVGERARVALAQAWIADGGAVDDAALVRARDGGTVVLERTTVRGFDRVGVRATDPGSRAELTDVRVVQTRHAADGRGVSIDGGAELLASRLAIRGVRNLGLDVRETATATVGDVAVHDVAVDALGGQGVGVAIESGARLVLERARVSGARASAVRAEDVGTRATLRDLDVTAEEGSGLSSRVSAELVLERVRVASVRGWGLAMGGASAVRARDLVIRGVRPFETEAVRGVEILAESRLELARASVEEVAGRGLTVQSGSRAVIEDLTIAGVRQHELGGEGQAIVVRDTGSTATVTRSLIRACEGGGAQTAVRGYLRLVDATIDNSAQPEDAGARQLDRAGLGASVARISGLRVRVVGMAGFGVAITASSTADLTQLAMVGGRNAGISVIEASRLTLTDSTIEDVLGCGLCIRQLGDIHATRLRVLGVREGARELGYGALVGDAGDLFLVDSVLGEASGAALRLFGNPSLVRIAPYVSMKRGGLVRSAVGVSSILGDSERGNIELEDVLSIGNGRDFEP